MVYGIAPDFFLFSDRFPGNKAHETGHDFGSFVLGLAVLFTLFAVLNWLHEKS